MINDLLLIVLKLHKLPLYVSVVSTSTAINKEPSASSESHIVAYIIAGIIVGIIFCVYLYLNKRRGLRNEDTLESLVDKDCIKKKVDDYFISFTNDRKDYELYSFYSRQFDLEDYYMDYSKKVEYIGSLYDLGINKHEIEYARQLLKDNVTEISKVDSKDFVESKCLIFLLDYYEILAKQKALSQIKDKVTDKERFEKYRNDNEGRIKKLINDLKL